MITETVPVLEAANSTKTIPVSEIFGPTLEGEGPWAGQPTYFLRIGGCDYGCLWCDTDQAVLAENVRKLPRLNQEQIWQQLFDWTREHPGPDLLAISGGNPGLYDLSSIVTWWQTQERPANGHYSGQKKVLVETQGSKWQPWFGKVNLLTVSPKPPSSGLAREQSMENLEGFMHNVAVAEEEFMRRKLYDPGIPADDWQMIFKVVVFDEEDYQFARALHIRYPLIKFHLSTGTAMGGLSGKWYPKSGTPIYNPVSPVPQWAVPGDRLGAYPIDTKDLLLGRYRWLAERAMSDDAMADAQVQVQLHCLLWGITTKGV